MKRKSILLTCIVAIMALAMFVGCDNAPTLPSFVVGGTINQTGDFLEGQAFDPSKFTVTITYDNGRIVAADETVSVYLDTDENNDGKVNFGDTVKADLGKNFADSDICATAAVKVYIIKSLAVTGPESYDGKPEPGEKTATIDIPESDLTVTATYLDSTNAEKTMILAPGEYVVEAATVEELTEDNPSVEAKAKVNALIGNFNDIVPVSTYFNFTATWDGESTKLPEDAVVSKIDVEFAENVTAYSLAKLDYGTALPAVDDSKLKVTAFVGDEEYTVDSSDVTFTWVDGDGYAFNSNNLLTDKESSVGILAEFAGVSYVFTSDNLTLENVTVSVEKAGTYKDPELVAGAALPDLASMLKAYYTVGEEGEAIRIAPDDEALTWVYASKTVAGGSVSGSTPIKDAKLPAVGTYVIVYPVYKGQAADAGISLGAVKKAVAVTDIIGVELSDDFAAPAAQYYDEAPVAPLSAIASITVQYDDEKSTTEKIENADFNGRVAVKYVNNVTGAILDKDFYSTMAAIRVEFTPEGSETPIISYSDAFKLPAAYADRIVLNAEYDKGVGSMVKFTAEARNANGRVYPAGYEDSNLDIVVLDVEGNDVTDEDIKVTAEDQQFSATGWIETSAGVKELLESEMITVEGGVGYVTVNEDNLTFKLADGFYALIGKRLDTLVPENFVPASAEVPSEDKAAGFVEHGASIEITDVVATRALIVAGDNNEVVIEYQYVNEKGDTVESSKTVTVFGTDWVTDVKAELKPTSVYYPGMTYNKVHFDVQITLASGVKADASSYPGFEYDIVGDSVVGPAGTPQTVTFEYSYAGEEETFTASVTPAADYPTDITATQVKRINSAQPYDESYFDFEITWVSGLAHEDDAPEVTYTFDPEKAGHNASEETVTINWTCGTKNGTTSVNVTPGVPV